jgi:hypothetical protein
MKIKTFYNIILKQIRTYEAVVKAHTGAVEAHHGAMKFTLEAWRLIQEPQAL